MPARAVVSKTLPVPQPISKTVPQRFFGQIDIERHIDKVHRSISGIIVFGSYEIRIDVCWHLQTLITPALERCSFTILARAGSNFRRPSWQLAGSVAWVMSAQGLQKRGSSSHAGPLRGRRGVRRERPWELRRPKRRVRRHSSRR
jgi:hypothetical protein